MLLTIINTHICKEKESCEKQCAKKIIHNSVLNMADT